MLLLICVIGLTLLPFFIPHAGDYSGSDNQAQQAIAQLDPNYKPWFAPCLRGLPVVKLKVCCLPCRVYWLCYRVLHPPVIIGKASSHADH